MSSFSRPEILVFIPVALGILLFVHLRSRKLAKKRIRILVSKKLMSRLIPQFSEKRALLKFIFFLTSIVFCCFALSGPQWGSTQRSVTPQGIDLLIAVDLSKSMLAEDVSPNRLERVKLNISNLLDQVKGDRVGMIAFSGTAFLHCPLTLDHQAFSKTLNELEVGLIPKMGTDLGHPIDEARRSFSKDDKDKFLILISDGEDLEGRGLMQAKEAAKEGIQIFTIGIGSEKGARIPSSKIKAGVQNYLKDRQGNEILTKLDKSSLEKIATATGAQYVPLGPTGEGLSHVFKELRSIGEKKKREQLSTELPIDRFQVFLIIALFFLVLESLTITIKPKGRSGIMQCLLISLSLLGGCWVPDNIGKAELALAEGMPLKAAEHYISEIEIIKKSGNEPSAELLLNAGLAYSQGNDFEEANSLLNSSLDLSFDDPSIQSKALNALGNLHYHKTNQHLDNQDVNSARKTWEQALRNYKSAYSLDGNLKAQTNLDSLNQQIKNRIESMVSKLEGLVWRDVNGNGKKENTEPTLPAYIFWDKNGDGERNASTEPSIATNKLGQFAFEWISETYPTNLNLGSVLMENNKTTEAEVLLPLFPPPPPPFSARDAKNHYVEIKKPGPRFLPMPWRAAPLIKGKIWNDQNKDGKLDVNESALSSASLYFDLNGNFQLDENESSFKPSDDGSFAQLVPPGQYSLCVKPDSPEAIITKPVGDNKAYLTWVDFESPSDLLLFGIFDEQSGGNSSQQSQDQSNEGEETNDPNNQSNSQERKQDNSEPTTPEEVSGLYERLLQEMESKSEPLPQEGESFESIGSGRDY